MDLQKPVVESSSGRDPSKLKSGTVGAPGITFFVVAAAAPLTCVIGITPLIIGFGVGVAAPLVYLVIGAVLLLFAAGYVAMTKRVRNAGALYAYIAQGLGPSAGVSAAFVALLAYVTALVTLTAFAAYAMSGLILHLVGIDVPWFVCCVVAVVAATLLGLRDAAVGAKILSVLLIAEVAILIVLAIAILIEGGGPEGVSAAPLNPGGLITGGLGVSLAFAYASYIGFEQTAIYSEEARDPNRSVKRATYFTIIGVSIFYVFISWMVVVAVGPGSAITIAGGDPGGFITGIGSSYLGSAAVHVLNVLVVTSSFAAVFSFHNATSRYAYSLGREAVLPSFLGHSHPVRSTPHRASYLTGAVNLGILAVCVAVGLDPYLDVFSWGAAASAIGFIGLQAVCAIAIFAHFRRVPSTEDGTWTTQVSPILAAVGLGIVFFLIATNFSSLVGVDTEYVGLLVPFGYFAIAMVGLVYGQWLRKNDNECWAHVGRGGVALAESEYTTNTVLDQ